MAPPPASIAQMTEQFTAAPLSALPQAARLGVWQTTVAKEATLSGIGLIRVVRSIYVCCLPLLIRVLSSSALILKTKAKRLFPLCAPVCEVTLSSKIGNRFGHVVGTVEHLMAALQVTH